MEALFSLPFYRGKKGDTTFVFNNFQQALEALLKQNLLYIEYYLDAFFYPNKIQKITLKEPKRIYLAEIIDYKTARYKAINYKWLTLPPDFLYDKGYTTQNFLYSKKAREIAPMFHGDFICLTEEGINNLLSANDKNPPHPHDSIVLVKDIEFSVGNGKECKKSKNLSASLELMRIKPHFNILKLTPLSYKFSGKLERGEATELKFGGENLSLKNIELWKRIEKSLRI